MRIFLRIQLQKLTRFRKSLPYKSWCNDIRYGWNMCWCKILNTDRWLILLFFSICLLPECGFSAAKAKIAAALFSWTIGQQYPIHVYYHGYRKKFSYFAWLEWSCVVGRLTRLKIGDNVIEKKTWFHLKKWSWPWRSFSASSDKK